MNAGRPLQFDPDVVLAKATALFWEKGFEATSTVDLMAVMSLSKSSLYQAFGSKQELFNRCIEHYGDMNQKFLHEELEKAASGKKYLLSVFQQVINGENDCPKGCFLVNTACELGGSNDAINALLNKKVEKNRQAIEIAIRRAQQEGDISKDKDAKQLSDYLMTSLCGLRVMEQMQYSKTKMQNIINQILKSID